MGLNRRSLGLLAGAAATVVAAPRLLQWAAPLPETRPLRSLAGFEVMRSGAVTGAGVGMAGLNARPAPPQARLDAIRADPISALYDLPAAGLPEGAVPLAVFTDVNCPNCRVVSATLIDWLREGRDDLSVTFHELPLLGATSIAAARAALAAGLQGGYLPVHERMMQGRFRPSPVFLRTLAEDAGLDPVQMQRDMTSPAVDARLRRSADLAYVLGIPGTPGTVIDRTLVIGALDAPLLTRLIRRARTGLA